MNFTARDYEVVQARTGTEALTSAARDRPDLIVLDLGLPDVSGVDVIRGVRAHAETPIIVLSARVGSPDKVQALDLGADDYVTKPFSMQELLARVRAVTRRAEPAVGAAPYPARRHHGRPRGHHRHPVQRRAHPSHADRVASADGAHA